MKYIKSVEQYGGSILQKWLSKDNFIFKVSEDNEEALISINNDQGCCTGCLYERFINKYHDKYDVNFGGAMPPTIRCKKSDLKTIMHLLESIDKNNLYFDDVR